MHCSQNRTKTFLLRRVALPLYLKLHLSRFVVDMGHWVGGREATACRGLFAQTVGLKAAIGLGGNSALHPNRPKARQCNAIRKWGEKWGKTRKTPATRMK